VLYLSLAALVNNQQRAMLDWFTAGQTSEANSTSYLSKIVGLMLNILEYCRVIEAELFEINPIRLNDR
jgi:hypothetical protein